MLKKNCLTAKLIHHTGKQYIAFAPDGTTWTCSLKGKLRLTHTQVSNPLCVGDQVRIIPDDITPYTGVIEEVLVRANYIARRHPRSPHLTQYMASNIDQMLVLISLQMPFTSSYFIDKCLAIATEQDIEVLMVFTKQDLLQKEKYKALQEEMWKVYKALGYVCLTSSKHQGIDKSHLMARTTLLLGHSGVGKSTFVNHIIPHAKQRTQEVSVATQKGKHTTMHTTSFFISPNTYLIDTPGIKEIALLSPLHSACYFPEIQQAAAACTFHDCQHHEEKGCEVLKFVENGKIARFRYKNYLHMEKERKKGTI